MGKLKNLSPGVRFVNARNERTPDGEPQLVAILPGQTLDVDVFDEDDPVYKGMVDKGDLDVDGGRSKQIATLQEEKRKIEEQLKAAHAKLQAQEDEAHVDRLMNDPVHQERRQQAMIAGNAEDALRVAELQAEKPQGVDSRGTGEVGKKTPPQQGREQAAPQERPREAPAKR
jgi:hypothetical protein